MNKIERQIVISEISPFMFKTFGHVNKDKLYKKGSSGEISLEAMSIGIESAEGGHGMAESQHAYVQSLISKARDNALLAILKTVDEEQAEELQKAIAKVDSLKAGLLATHRDELKELRDFYLETTDVKPSVIKKVFSVNYATGFDKLGD